MLISCLLIFLIVIQFRYLSPQKKNFVAVLFLLYLLYCFFDLVYLNIDYDTSFHISDASKYYNVAKHSSSITDIIKLQGESTNVFYYFINYYYCYLYGNEFIVSLLIRLNNILLIILTYLLSTQAISKVRLVDYALFLNPLLLTIIARNVRDIYILFFLVLLLLSCGLLPSRKSFSSVSKFIFAFLLFLVRPVCLVPFAALLLFKYSKKNRAKGAILILIGIGIILYFWPIIQQAIMAQFVSAIEFAGEEKDEYMSLYYGEGGAGAVVPMLIRAFKGCIALIFTPHPYKYYESWVSIMDSNGTYGIYTGLDNLMIVLGAAYTYIKVIPMIFAQIFEKKSYNNEVFIYALIFASIYTLAYLGITDIRNHYTTYYLFLLPLLSNLYDIKVKKRDYILTLIIFLGLLAI